MLVMERTTGLSSRRSKGREAMFTIKKSTKMVDIKVHVSKAYPRFVRPRRCKLITLSGNGRIWSHTGVSGFEP